MGKHNSCVFSKAKLTGARKGPMSIRTRFEFILILILINRKAFSPELTLKNTEKPEPNFSFFTFQGGEAGRGIVFYF